MVEIKYGTLSLDAQAMKLRDVPSGYCEICGVGFAEYIACENSGCNWRDDPNRSPHFQFARAHPQLDGVGRWQTASGPATTAPVDGWQTE